MITSSTLIPEKYLNSVIQECRKLLTPPVSLTVLNLLIIPCIFTEEKKNLLKGGDKNRLKKIITFGSIFKFPFIE
jgi:hypothetical protein